MTQTNPTMGPLIDPVVTTVNRIIDERLEMMAASWLPTLEQPKEVLYQVRQTNGIFRTVTVQEMIQLRGKGRDIQVVLIWSGAEQK